MVVTFSEMMMNQTKLLVNPSVSRKSVTAKAVLVHPKDVSVKLARAERRIMNLAKLSGVTPRSQLCRPSLNSTTRAVVMISVANIVDC